MFRPLRRFKQEASREECLKLLREERRVLLAVNGENGYPYAIPVNYYFDEETETVWIHSAREGHKLDAIKKDSKVCLTLMNEGYKDPGDWAYHLTSVVIFGQARLEEGERAMKMLLQLGYKYFPDEAEMLADYQRNHHRVSMIAVSIDHMTGKHVHEK